MFKTIINFSQVELSNQKTLIICDIDKTLLYWVDKDPADFYLMLKDDFPDFTEEEIHREALDFVNMYNQVIAKPIHTDFEGFTNMVSKIRQLSESKLIFLTARKESDAKYTEKNFKDIGLNYNDFEVYYTNNIVSKGEYIKNNINLSEYEHVIFIDDYESYIKTVYDLFPQTICYKFEIATC
jgi:hypothetical protein